MKVLVFIEHDIILRHFVYNDVLRNLISRHEVRFVFPESGGKRLTTDVSRLSLGAPYVRIPIDNYRVRLWKELFLVDQLRWRPGRVFARSRRIWRHYQSTKAKVLYTVLGLPILYPLFQSWSQRKLKDRGCAPLTVLFDREAPDVVIHPSVLDGVFINDLVDVSRQREIPMIAIMNSWDNPSTKRVMIGSPDWLLVWGEQTRRHAVEFAGMPEDRVISFGAAQFDVFRTPPRITRAEFCARHDIDPDAKILLYAGSSKGADEFSHLVMIDEAIENGILGNTVVVYRPHPWGKGGMGGERFLGHPWRHVRIESSMRAYLEGIRAGEGELFLSNYADTHDVLSSIDALVSPLSTIILEGALHEKPILCFLPGQNVGSSVREQARMIHFEEMLSDPTIPVARGDDSLIPKLQELLDLVGDANYAARDRSACEFFVQTFARPYDVRLTEFVEIIGGDGVDAKRDEVAIAV